MWQKCPICNGEGKVTNDGYTSSVFSTCPTCNGARIISGLNGLPPNGWQQKAEPKINGRQEEVCSCGHTRDRHYTNEGQCYECGCTWFYEDKIKKKKSRK